jgi:sulfite exporter TauE/SafE
VLIENVTAALALGFFGSLHCVAMCGPIGAAASRALPYQAGRFISYAFAGALFGSLGAQASQLGAWQRAFTVAVAALLLGKGLSLLFPRRGEALLKLGRNRSWFALPRSALALGLVTGALPCGLLTGAWALAASTAHPLDGTLVMTIFAVATAPALVGSRLLATPLVGARWAPAWQGVLFCALAIWIGVRPFLGGHACH